MLYLEHTSGPCLGLMIFWQNWVKQKFFTTLDLRLGYHHIALDRDAIKKTAFVTSFGKNEYLKVPFGLAQAPSYFQNLMNKLLNGLNFTLAYLDIIIFSETAKQHLKQIQIVLNRLRQAKLKLKKSKYVLYICFQRKLDYYLIHKANEKHIWQMVVFHPNVHVHEHLLDKRMICMHMHIP